MRLDGTDWSARFDGRRPRRRSGHPTAVVAYYGRQITTNGIFRSPQRREPVTDRHTGRRCNGGTTTTRAAQGS